MPHHLAQRRAHEQLKAHERAGGVAREAEKRRLAQQAKGHGFARLDGDTVEEDLAFALDERRHIVVIAGGRAAGRHHDIALRRRATDELADTLLVVGRDAVEHGLCARLAGRRHERGPVDISDLAARGNRTGIDELGAERDDAHARGAMHRHERMAGIGK
ncbi:Uncharacterised protein [Collinsella intestinalis]|nr:Uncharacterised protein [Collinsella intestinalis]